MPDGSIGKAPDLPPDFQQAAAPLASMPEPPKVIVSLPLDTDLLAYFQSEGEPGQWAEHINGVLRFYMDTNQAREADFHAAMETAKEPEPAPAP